MSIPILIISGPVGVGKTSSGEELSEVLDERGIPHTFVDFDQLGYTYPRVPEDPWSNGLGFKIARNLVVSSVVEDWDFVKGIEQAIPDAEVKTVQLFASPESLVSRVEKREIGSGLDWHRNRSLELLKLLQAESVPRDFTVQSYGKSIIEIAQELFELVDWRAP